MKILLTKTMSGHLAPINEEEAEHLKRIKVGDIAEATIVRKRNPEFFRKWWALINVGFEAWTETCPPMEYLGEPIQPNLERFRKDVTVLAGFYEPTFNLKGELRLEPMSVSFASMDEDDFEKLYSATIDVLLRRVLSAQGYTTESLRAHVDKVLSFN